MGITGLCRRKLYKLRERGKFPMPIRLAANAVAYRPDDVEAWMRANISPRFHFDDRSI